jgi:hypothetical protein
LKGFTLQKSILFLLPLWLCSSAYGDDFRQADGTYVSPYCAVGDEVFGSTPGANSYSGTEDPYAMRKPDGGLIAIAAKRGIGCEVVLRPENGKVLAHVIARRISYDPPALDKDKVLLTEPKSRVNYWEKDFDLTNVDQIGLSQEEVPLKMKLVVGVLRTKP